MVLDLEPRELEALALGLDRLLDSLRRDGVRPPARLVQLAALLHERARVGLSATSAPLSEVWPESGPMPRLLLTKTQVAEALEVSERTVSRLTEKGDLRAVGVLGLKRWPRVEVEAYVRHLNTLAVGEEGAQLVDEFKAELSVFKGLAG